MDSAKFTTIRGVTVTEDKIIFPQCFDGNIQIDVSYGTSYDLKNNDFCSIKCPCWEDSQETHKEQSYIFSSDYIKVIQNHHYNLFILIFTLTWLSLDIIEIDKIHFIKRTVNPLLLIHSDPN